MFLGFLGIKCCEKNMKFTYFSILLLPVWLVSSVQAQFVSLPVFELKVPAGLQYNGGSDIYYNKWYDIGTETPTMTNYDSRRTLTFSISPALPAGLSFDTSNGEITGIPTEYDETGTTYTITASNQAGSSVDTPNNLCNPS